MGVGVGVGGQVFDNNTKDLILKSVTMGRGGQKSSRIV